jgi:hypothetical protein
MEYDRFIGENIDAYSYNTHMSYNADIPYSDARTRHNMPNNYYDDTNIYSDSVRYHDDSGRHYSDSGRHYTGNIPNVSGKLNPNYYRPDDTHIYGYGVQPQQNELLHDNFGNPYLGRLFSQYLGNKAGFSPGRVFNTGNNSSWQIIIIVLLVILIVVSTISVIINIANAKKITY